MDNGIYIALSRQQALVRDMEVTANNLANVNTSGYKSSHAMFTSFLADAGKNDKMAYAYDVSTYRNTEQGSLRTTGNMLDVAIQGEGYFVVQTPLGERYTRAGNFQLDGTGILVTAEGYPVLDNNSQQIILPEDAREVIIGAAGNVTVNGEDFSVLNVVNFENPQVLEPVGDKLFKTDVAPDPVENVKVAQGMLENSNVQPVMELTHMIDVSRSVGHTAKMIEVMYELQRKTATTWTQQG